MLAQRECRVDGVHQGTSRSGGEGWLQTCAQRGFCNGQCLCVTALRVEHGGSGSVKIGAHFRVRGGKRRPGFIDQAAGGADVALPDGQLPDPKGARSTGHISLDVLVVHLEILGVQRRRIVPPPQLHQSGQSCHGVEDGTATVAEAARDRLAVSVRS